MLRAEGNTVFTPIATAPTSSASYCTRLEVITGQPTAFVDLTAELERCVAAARIRVGTLTVQTLHTTTGLIVNESEPLLLTDFQSMFSRLVPRRAGYHHDDLARRIGVPLDEPPNGHAHCRALLLQPSLSLTVVDGRMVLGRWQRVMFVELDGPRPRELSVVVFGELAD